MPVRYERGKMYWWKAHADHKVLVRLLSFGGSYLAVRIMVIDAAAALRIGYGAYETVNLDMRTAALEDV